MPTPPSSGVPACSDPEDHIIRSEQLACIKEHLADVRRQRQHVSEQILVVQAQCLAAGIGSPQWHRLVHDYRTLCATRTTLLQDWGYWCEEYQALHQSRPSRGARAISDEL